MNGDDDNLRALGAFGWTRVVRVGVGEQCDLRIRDFSENAQGASFGLEWRGRPWERVEWSQPGLYNARNAAMAALAAGLALDAENPTKLQLGALARPPREAFGAFVVIEGIEGAHHHLGDDGDPQIGAHWRPPSEFVWSAKIDCWRTSTPNSGWRRVSSKLNRP